MITCFRYLTWLLHSYVAVIRSDQVFGIISDILVFLTSTYLETLQIEYKCGIRILKNVEQIFKKFPAHP